MIKRVKLLEADVCLHLSATYLAAMQNKLKVIILTHGGAERFIELLSEIPEVEVAGIFVETVQTKERPLAEKLRRSIRYDGVSATLGKLVRQYIIRRPEAGKQGQDARSNLQATAERFGIEVVDVDNYHSDASLKRLRSAGADLGILYGTNIVRESVFGIPKLGSINIHQGLAPLYRGGPTVFWELMNGETEVGITVHFVAARVDTGDIVLQRTVPLEYDFDRYGLDFESFIADFRSSMAEPASRLLAEAVRLIAAGEEQRKEQDTSIGKRYRLPTKSEKDRLLTILKKRQKSVRAGAGLPVRSEKAAPENTL